MSTIADPITQKDKIKPLWRDCDYLILTSGNGISAVGSQVSLVALWLGQLSYLQLYIVALLEGTLAVFFTLAMAASIPRIVDQRQIPDATAQEQTIESLAGTTGPALGPILYASGSMIPFLTDAISYACSVISLLFIKTRFQEECVVDRAMLSHLWKEIKEGMVWLWHSPLLRFLALHTFGLIT